jgi:glycosyltransferase involved in cell wall biosynthesis
MAQELVSIAVCTYNGAAYLSEQLDTLVNQTYPNCEIVVVDDCSKDNTVKILREYADKYSQIRIHINTENLGYTGNFEKAIRLCKGEYIALCDQDDIWDTQKIEMQFSKIKDNILIYHDSEFIHEDGTSMNKKMSDILNLYSGDRPEVFLFFNCVSGHSILMKRELLEFALPLKEGSFHDAWLAYVATNIGKIDFIPKCLVRYRQHDNSETNILNLSRQKDNYKMSAIESFEKTERWLAYCADFKFNKDPLLIKEIYLAYKQRKNKYISLKLTRLFFKYWETIFFMRKKSRLSKLNYIRKQIWGLKIKKQVF